MNLLNQDICRLITEAGLAAVNHAFRQEAEAIRAALPYLIADARIRRIIEATLLIGLGRADAATTLLEDDASDQAAVLRRLINSKRTVQPRPAAPPCYSPLVSPNHQENSNGNRSNQTGRSPSHTGVAARRRRSG